MTIDPDILIIRRILAAAKSTRKVKGGTKSVSYWIRGHGDNTAYFQKALAEFKQCRAEELL
jgi:hypothetical protein